MVVRARFRCLACLFIALTLPVVGAAHGGESGSAEDDRARELYIKGDRAYAEGDYESALEAFEEAYALSGRHALLYNMANAHERLGEPEKALDKLRKFLPHASSGQQKLLEKRMQSLQMRLDAQQQEEAKDEPQQAPEQHPEPSPEQSSNGAVTVNGDPAPPYLGYALVGVGALGLGFGTYFGTKALSARSDAEDACPDVNGERRCTKDAKDAIDRDQNNSLKADIGLGVGIASAAVGLWLILTHEGAPREAGTAARVYPAPRTGGGEVDLVLRF
jgi:tetratricopeptide (TPR) repeat protein